MDQIKIGAFLKQLRLEKNMTQEDIACRFAVTSRTVSRWETGSNMPDMSTISDLANFYEIEIDELFAGERKRSLIESAYLERSAEYAKIELSLTFWGSDARQKLTDILSIEPNDIDSADDPNVWSFSAGIFNGRIISPSFDAMTGLVMKCNFPYIAESLAKIRARQYLKSRLTMNIEAREHIPFMLFTQDILDFMSMTDTEFRVNFSFGGNETPSSDIFKGKTRFKLIIKGDDLNLDDLTSELRLGPGFKRKKEDFRGNNSQDMWIFETQYKDISAVSEEMKAFAAILGEKEDALKAIKKSRKCSSAVDIVLYITEHHPYYEFNLNRDIIRFAAETETQLGFNIY